jgi:hypothetical protein
MESPQSDEVTFSDGITEQMREGKLVCLAVVFYKPESDELMYHFPTNFPEEEAIAILKKYKCYPQ